MKRKLRCIILIVFCLFVVVHTYAFAAIKVPAIFGDNMVLQGNRKVPVWGWAQPGEQIRLEFLGRVFKTTATGDGKWSLKLSSYPAGGPYRMTIKGNGTRLTFKNILIGDVWVASGQSNMEFGIKNERNGSAAIASAHDSLLHLFTVPISTSLQPKQDIDTANMDKLVGKWIVCSPENLIYDHKPWTGFSAVGYYFGVQVRNITHAPVGIICTCKGGTPAQSWISLDGLAASPVFAKYVSAHQGFVDNYDKATVAYPQQMAAYRQAFDRWNNAYGKDYAAAVKQWEITRANAGSGETPPRPVLSHPAPPIPVPPDGGFSGPANLYNAMLAPVLRYGIKGVIWYQGENNGDSLPDALFYKTLFPQLINTWRSEWQQGNFPFLFVQLANFRAAAKIPAEGNWPWVREGQLKALALPKTAMAVTTDLGDADNIHPTDKQDVALRLALAARHLVYGEDVIYTGPQYRSMKVEGNKIVVTFDRISALTVGINTKSGNSLPLKGFGIAGADHQFYWANAQINGNIITIYNDQVDKPEAVRYNWADNPPGNLYNQAGLPASAFRTDDWPATLPTNNKL